MVTAMLMPISDKPGHRYSWALPTGFTPFTSIFGRGPTSLLFAATRTEKALRSHIADGHFLRQDVYARTLGMYSIGSFRILSSPPINLP